jgi:hypothetical protein
VALRVAVNYNSLCDYPILGKITIYMWSLTGSANEMQLCTRLGARDFLKKPIEDDEWTQFQIFLEEQIGKLTL